MNDESVVPGQKKTVDWTISVEVQKSLVDLARDAEKKVNCILGSRQTDDDLKTLFALDPGETKQRLMRL